MSLKGNSASAGKRRAIAVNLFAAWLITFHANIMILHFSGIFSRKSLAAATPRLESMCFNECIIPSGRYLCEKL